MKTTLKIVAIGDSLIYGRHDAHAGGWIGRLRTWLEKKNQWSAVYNLGIGGNDTRRLLKRMDGELSVRNFNGIIIGIGTNDARQKSAINNDSQVPLDEFHANFYRIMEVANKYCSKIIVAAIPPVDEQRTTPLKSFYYLNQVNREYWRIEKSVSEKFNALFLDFWPIVEKNKEKIFSDGVHFNEDGHQFFFQHASKQIETFLS